MRVGGGKTEKLGCPLAENALVLTVLVNKPLAISISLLVMLALAPGASPKPGGAPATARSPSAHVPVDFARDIQPILAAKCYACHGPEKQKSGLRLDQKNSALAGGDDGQVIRPGHSAESPLIKSVAGLNPDKLMPPKGERLTDRQVSLLRAWIDAGAPWPDQPSALNPPLSTAHHWAFKAPVLPAPPKTKNSRWIRNPIDAFVLSRLEKERVKPSPEADRITLIRRLSLDLLGLPPSPEDVAAFLNDLRSDAYEQLVDRLLGSPHFGEQWGRHWLDLARYADSDGYEKDTARPDAWLFRDWVIDAVNRDLPFDQFTVEQLAGDLLPNATHEQKVATAFHRQTLTNKEGGVDQEEYRCKATVDRVTTTGAVWLGLTVGCAECHSHKYDPISQREFYQLFAFFNDASEQELPAPRPAELAKYEAAKKIWGEQDAKLKASLTAYLKNELPARQAAWEKTVQTSPATWITFEPKQAMAANGSTLKTQKDKSIVAGGKAVDIDTYTVEIETGELKGVTGFRLEVLPESEKRRAVGRSSSSNFVLTDFAVQAGPAAVPLHNASADFSQDTFWPSGALDEDKQKTGWAVAPETGRAHVAVFETKDPLNLPAGTKLVFILDQQYGGAHTIARFRLSATTSVAPLRADLMPEAVVVALTTPAEQRSPAQRAALAKYFSEQGDAGARKLNDQIAAHAKTAPAFPATKASVLAQEPRGRKTHVHIRGDFQRPGDEVLPATLAVMHAFKPRAGKPDRLDLARWLVDPANPLTARVTVNHFWKNLFDRALVPTVNDFGLRGDKPSHPELLDWLAVTFQSPPNFELATPNAQPGLGWSRKAMIKLIVTSATYRQWSHTRPELLGRDPTNVWLARQNRFRLEAENVRDAYLTASGLLNPAVGGASIRPPLPADIAALGYAGSVTWPESKDAEQYRRGVYIFFQRTVPYPMLMTFDAPDSNVACTRRERSNTPLQALTLLNDPVFFECARALGKRMAAHDATDPAEQIKHGFERCLSRPPGREALARLQRLYQDQLRLAENQPEGAARIAGESKSSAPGVAERATLVAVARIILNLDEFVTRE